eukprot:1155099-Pelagomonas_calceolata.AAC.5
MDEDRGGGEAGACWLLSASGCWGCVLLLLGCLDGARAAEGEAAQLICSGQLHCSCCAPDGGGHGHRAGAVAAAEEGCWSSVRLLAHGSSD